MVNDDFIKRLEDGLEGVTPGPWQKSGVVAELVSQKCQAVGPDPYNIAFVPVGSTDADYMGALRDAYHIARCSPDNIRGLLARLRMAEAKVSYITMPTTVEEAIAMQKLGYAWIAENAPEQLTDLARENEALRVALEPFAAAAPIFDHNINPAPNKDDDDVYTWYPKYLPPDEFVTIKVGDFRRARAALEEK